MSKDHHYELAVRWTGNLGPGTTGYGSYRRDHEVTAVGLPTILGSSDPHFRGDRTRWNPEQLFLASVAQCHMLWYLSLAAEAGVVVTSYVDQATGVMVEESSGAGQFVGMTLHPHVRIVDARTRTLAEELHGRAAELCFIARSVTFPIRHEPIVTTESSPG